VRLETVSVDSKKRTYGLGTSSDDLRNRPLRVICIHPSTYVAYAKGGGGQGGASNRRYQWEDTKHADGGCRQMWWQKYGGSEFAVQVSFGDKIDVFARHSRSRLVREFGSDRDCHKVDVGGVVGAERRRRCVMGA